MKRLTLCLGAVICAASILLSGCACSSKSVSYKDGTYEGKSSTYVSDDGTDNGNGYGVVTLTITDGKISDCTYETYEEDGTLKGVDYGKEGGEVKNKDYYNKAQKANAACSEYAKMLVENGQLDGIDSISGATINYNEFIEAVEDVLKKAEA